MKSHRFCQYYFFAESALHYLLEPFIESVALSQMLLAFSTDIPLNCENRLRQGEAAGVVAASQLLREARQFML